MCYLNSALRSCFTLILKIRSIIFRYCRTSSTHPVDFASPPSFSTHVLISKNHTRAATIAFNQRTFKHVGIKSRLFLLTDRYFIFRTLEPAIWSSPLQPQTEWRGSAGQIWHLKCAWLSARSISTYSTPHTPPSLRRASTHNTSLNRTK